MVLPVPSHSLTPVLIQLTGPPYLTSEFDSKSRQENVYPANSEDDVVSDDRLQTRDELCEGADENEEIHEEGQEDARMSKQVRRNNVLNCD